jgi:coatomer subunit beta
VPQRLLDQAEADATATDETPEAPAAPKTTTKVLADGTYATETIFSSSSTAKLDAVKAASKPPLRSLILGGDYYTASVLAATLTKLVLRYAELSKDARGLNAIRAEAMLIMTSILRVGHSPFSAVPIDEDSVERITTCLQSLSSMDKDLQSIFLYDTQKAYTNMVAHEQTKVLEKQAKESKLVKVQADDLISFRQFSKKGAGDIDEVRRPACRPLVYVLMSRDSTRWT